MCEHILNTNNNYLLILLLHIIVVTFTYKNNRI